MKSKDTQPEPPIPQLRVVEFGRFITKFTVNETTGCWEWDAALTNKGYGYFKSKCNTGNVAHRWAYEFFVGPLEKGKVLDHVCRNRKCVNPSPDHLEQVTVRENNHRGENKQIRAHLSGMCLSGKHEATVENTYFGRDGSHKGCKPCTRERMVKNRARKKADAKNV